MVKANHKCNLASKIKTQTPTSLASIAFYGIAGIIFLIMLPLSGFPPHVGLIGITSIFAAYGLLIQRKWANWLVAALFFVATVFSLYTLYFVISTDIVAAAGMIAYAILTWIFTANCSEKTQRILARFLRRFSEKPNSNFFSSIHKLLVLSNLHKSVSLCQSCYGT